MGLLAFLMIFIAPIYQIKLLFKKFDHKTNKTIISITLLTIGLQIAITIIAAFLYELSVEYKSEEYRIRCDMTPIIFVVFSPFITFIIMPLIGSAAGIAWHRRNKKADDNVEHSSHT